VNAHHDALKRKHTSYAEYLEQVREQKVTVKNVYTTEALQRGNDSKRRRVKKKADAEQAKKEEEELQRVEAEKVRTVMAADSTFRKIVTEDPGLSKYIDAHPNLTKMQMRDELDKRPDLVAAFDKHPEALTKIGRAPALRLMLDSNKELKAALDKKREVREILESNPDLDRTKLNELVSSNAQLKDLYDSRPELKIILQERAKLFEEEQKSLEEQKPEAFIAGPMVRVSCKLLVKEGVIVSVAMPPKMVSRMTFVFSSVRSGTTHVLGQYGAQSAVAFDLQLEELLDMQHRREMVKDLGKIKLDVNKTLVFLNERMRF